jgi:acyl carrier protein
MSDTDLRSKLLERLTNIFRDVFDEDDILIKDTTTAEDIEDWDSLMHITLVLAVEQEFNLRLKAAEVGKLADVGALVDIMVERGR